LLGQLADQAHFLGDRDEAVGHDQSRRRVLPARQHFEADDLPGLQVDLRLEIGNELLVLEPVAKPLLDLAQGDQCALHAGIEPQGSGDAAVAGMIEGDVGAAQQVRHGDFVRRRGGDAQIGADLQHPAADFEWLRHRLQEHFAKLVGDLAIFLGNDEGDRELVAIQARGNRVRADRLEMAAAMARSRSSPTS
jgi:hypothetical protein